MIRQDTREYLKNHIISLRAALVVAFAVWYVEHGDSPYSAGEGALRDADALLYKITTQDLP